MDTERRKRGWILECAGGTRYRDGNPFDWRAEELGIPENEMAIRLGSIKIDETTTAYYDRRARERGMTYNAHGEFHGIYGHIVVTNLQEKTLEEIMGLIKENGTRDRDDRKMDAVVEAVFLDSDGSFRRLTGPLSDLAKSAFGDATLDTISGPNFQFYGLDRSEDRRKRHPAHACAALLVACGALSPYGHHRFLVLRTFDGEIPFPGDDRELLAVLAIDALCFALRRRNAAHARLNTSKLISRLVADHPRVDRQIERMYEFARSIPRFDIEFDPNTMRLGTNWKPHERRDGLVFYDMHAGFKRSSLVESCGDTTGRAARTWFVPETHPAAWILPRYAACGGGAHSDIGIVADADGKVVGMWIRSPPPKTPDGIARAVAIAASIWRAVGFVGEREFKAATCSNDLIALEFNTDEEKMRSAESIKGWKDMLSQPYSIACFQEDGAPVAISMPYTFAVV